MGKKFPTLYGTWMYIITFTTALYLSARWIMSIQSKPFQATFFWRCTLILPSNLLLGFLSWFFPSGFPTKTQYSFLFSPRYVAWNDHPRLFKFFISERGYEFNLMVSTYCTRRNSLKKCIYPIRSQAFFLKNITLLFLHRQERLYRQRK